LADINQLFAENAEFASYVKFDPNTGTITVDHAGLDAAGFDDEKGGEFDSFLGDLESSRDVFQGAEDRLEDIEDEVKEIGTRG
jgi:hypothetical protein